MVFSEYINSLPSRTSPRKDILDKIAEACGKDYVTVSRWANGSVTPGLLERKAISAVLNIPVDELFPNCE